MHNGH